MGIDNKIGITRVILCFRGRIRGLSIVYAELIVYVFPFFFNCCFCILPFMGAFHVFIIKCYMIHIILYWLESK